MAEPLQVGWREWLALPELGVNWIKAKVDTGARTSALAAREIQIETRDGEDWVTFKLPPMQDDNDTLVSIEAPIIEFREVTDSGGNTECRPVIRTQIKIGALNTIIDITLTDRSTMRFRMLLGRTALPPEAAVFPRTSFLLGGDRRRPPENP